MNFDCKKCKKFDVCEMTKELGFMNGGCRAYTEKKPQTNYDLLISKTPYELAEWIAKILDHCENKMPAELCRQSCPLYKCCCDQPSDNIEDWLKAPVEDREVDK